MSKTIVDYKASISNDLKSRLGITDNQLKKVVDALSNTLAGQFKLLDLRLFDIQKNLFPDTADLAIHGGELERLGHLYLGRGPFKATQGRYLVRLKAQGQAQIRSQLSFKSNETAKSTGKLYITDQPYTTKGSDDHIGIRSLELGPDIELALGDTLTITEPVLGVDQTVVVSAVIEQPKAAESTPVYRSSVLQAMQLEPQGGSRTDYILWGNDAQGVAHIYPYVKDNNSGTVQVYVEATEKDSTDALGTPSKELLEAVDKVIRHDPILRTARKPMLAALEVLPISLSPIDIRITGLDENTIRVRTSIETSVKAYLKSVRPFIDGANLLINRNDVLFSAKIQSVITDVLDSGNFFRELSVFVNGVQQVSTKFSKENIPYLRTLTID